MLAVEVVTAEIALIRIEVVVERVVAEEEVVSRSSNKSYQPDSYQAGLAATMLTVLTILRRSTSKTVTLIIVTVAEVVAIEPVVDLIVLELVLLY